MESLEKSNIIVTVASIKLAIEQALDEGRFAIQDAIYEFDKKLKKDMIERYGTTALLQQVDVWQALVGGTVEEKRDITDEQYRLVYDAVATFVKTL